MMLVYLHPQGHVVLPHNTAHVDMTADKVYVATFNMAANIWTTCGSHG